MFIAIDADALRRQDYDLALRVACEQLSSQGVRNYIHHWPSRTVELLDEKRMLRPVVDQVAGGIRLVAVKE